MSEWEKKLKRSFSRQHTDVTPMMMRFGQMVEDVGKKHLILRVPKDKIIDPQKLAALVGGVVLPSSIENVPENLKLPHVVITQTNAFTRLNEMEVPSSLGSGMVLVQHGRDKLKFHMNGTLWITTSGRVPKEFADRCTEVKIPEGADVWLEVEEEPTVEEPPVKEEEPPEEPPTEETPEEESE